jgi:hypothetical protein
LKRHEFDPGFGNKPAQFGWEFDQKLAWREWGGVDANNAATSGGGSVVRPLY